MKPKLLTLAKPEYVFLLLSSIFGVLFVLLTPPFQSPDENRHFYRAYHISQGSFSAKKVDGRVGGFLPKKVRKSLKPFDSMRGQQETITSRNEINRAIHDEVDNTIEFVDFPSVAVYTPISYLPQAVGIRLARLFSGSPIIAVYAGRLVALLSWMLILFFAIKTTPILKWMFVVLALLPMSLYISASLSSDTVTNAIVFLLLAVLFKQAFSDQQQSKKDFLILSLLVVLLASAKFIYSPLVLLYFLIPLKNFQSKKEFILRFLMLSALVLITASCWPLIQGVGYVPYADYNVEYRDQVNLLQCSDIHNQLGHITSHPTFVFRAIGNSIYESFNVYYMGFIGNFGWGESPLSSFWLVFGYIGLALVALIDNRPEIKINTSKRVLVFGSFSILFALIVISQLLIWTCVGGDVVQNLQGRYFIPVGPLLFFMFYGVSNRITKYLPIGAASFSFLLLFVSAQTIYDRFYAPPEYNIERVLCDHEKRSEMLDFGTSNPKVFAKNGSSRSDEQARSGKYSSKISSESPYGTALKFEGCSRGDLFEIEAWRYGPHGEIVLANDGGDAEFFQAEKTADTTFGDWQRIRFSVRIPPTISNMDMLCFTGYFEQADSCYFDDIKVTLKRLEK
ncbi:MAG: DUF2142 domain-containing protein [Crocinitomicaceae bacterium]